MSVVISIYFSKLSTDRFTNLLLWCLKSHSISKFLYYLLYVFYMHSIQLFKPTIRRTVQHRRAKSKALTAQKGHRLLAFKAQPIYFVRSMLWALPKGFHTLQRTCPYLTFLLGASGGVRKIVFAIRVYILANIFSLRNVREKSTLKHISYVYIKIFEICSPRFWC